MLTGWTRWLTLVFMCLAVLAPVLWLVTPLAWFDVLYRGVVAGAPVLGTIAFPIPFLVHRLLVPLQKAMCASLKVARVHVRLIALNDE